MINIPKECFQNDTTQFNPLTHMLILRSSSSIANKHMMAKIRTNGDTIICTSKKYCRRISPFPTMFPKAVSC